MTANGHHPLAKNLFSREVKRVFLDVSLTPHPQTLGEKDSPKGYAIRSRVFIGLKRDYMPKYSNPPEGVKAA
jgi:hypothetical protein